MRYINRIFLLAALSLLTACGQAVTHTDTDQAVATTDQAIATFAGGCFWCMEPPFDKLDGVISTTSGYIGGHVDKPTYRQVSRGRTGHTEAIRIVYDPQRISYAELLEVYWRNIDPTDAKGQFCDMGDHYRSEIFYHDAEQQRLASKSRAALQEQNLLKDPVVTQVTAASTFWPAEEYHQDYYQKNPVRYRSYRFLCGRDKRLKELWGSSKLLSGFGTLNELRHDME